MQKIAPLLDKTKKCIAGQYPPCARNCPLNLDLRGMLEKVAAGQFDAAWKILNRDAILGGICCYICEEQCRNGCVRKNVDSSVNIREIEKFLFHFQEQKEERSFYVSPKKEKVLVIGAGIAGLACAIKMASRGYDTDVIDENSIGGHLKQVDKKILPENVLQFELKRISNIKHIQIIENKQITQVDKENYDAVVIATGKDGDTFGFTKESEAQGVFLTGHLVTPDADDLTVIRNSSLLSYVVENYCKVKRPVYPEGTEYVCDFNPVTDGIEPKKEIQKNGELYSEEQTKEEASRCELCKCTVCFDGCQMMQHYNKDVERLSRDISDTISRTMLNRKTALRQILTCSQCGNCTAECPAGVDMEGLILESRRYLHDTKNLPDGRYDYYINDLEHANGERASFLHKEGEAINHLFFPGCQMSASSPESVIRIFSVLKDVYKDKIGLYEHCCGIPALWAGDMQQFQKSLNDIRTVWEETGRPTFILACPSCAKLFQNHLKEIGIVSLWEILDEISEQKESNGKKVYVFDPCSSRNSKATREAVRNLLKKHGFDIENETSDNILNSCCGYGGLVKSESDELAEKMAKACLPNTNTPIVTYCTNCKESLAKQRGSVFYLSEMLFDEESPMCGENDLNKRIINREKLKETVMNTVMENNESWRKIRLTIPDEIQAKMNRQKILKENIQKLIDYAEETGKYIIEESTDVRTAYLQERNVTFWAVYKKSEDGSFKLENVYFHRLVIGPEGL